MAQWISVKDQLPENDQAVLIALNYKSGEIVTAIYLQNFCTIRKAYNHVFIVGMPPRVKLVGDEHRQFYMEKRQVSYWMPLPKPPNYNTIYDA